MKSDREKQDELMDRIEQHFKETPPEVVLERAKEIMREMEAHGMPEQNHPAVERFLARVAEVQGENARKSVERFLTNRCDHVPARPDVDMTICWKCSVEIVNDPDTQLWRPLTATERLVKLETVRQCRDLLFTLHQSEYMRVLWEKIETKLAPSIRLAESILGRWIVVNGQDESLAWSGSRWVPHRNGMGIEVQVSNFETREEAAAYAAEQFPGKTPDPGP